jgi:hypothetical protein
VSHIARTAAILQNDGPGIKNTAVCCGRHGHFNRIVANSIKGAAAVSVTLIIYNEQGNCECNEIRQSIFHLLLNYLQLALAVYRVSRTRRRPMNQ